MGLSVKCDSIPNVPGHVVVPEINITDYLADKARKEKRGRECFLKTPDPFFV